MFHIIHPNRNFFWAVSFIFVFGILVLGAFERWNIEEESASPAFAETHRKALPRTLADWNMYQNKDYRFGFQYPKSWTILESSKGSVLMSPYSHREGENPILVVKAISLASNQKLGDIFNGKSEEKFDFKNDCKPTLLSDYSAQRCSSPMSVGDTIILEKDYVVYALFDSVLSEDSERLISTFRIIK